MDSCLSSLLLKEGFVIFNSLHRETIRRWDTAVNCPIYFYIILFLHSV